MRDENVVDRGEDNYSEEGKWDFHGDASGSIGFFSASADTNARGSHNASSTRDYLREHRGHVEMSDNLSVEATRKAHSISFGEVSTRSHAEGETEDHFEASRANSAIPINATRSHSFSTASTKSRRSSLSWLRLSVASWIPWRQCPCRRTPSALLDRLPRCRKTSRQPTSSAWQFRKRLSRPTRISASSPRATCCPRRYPLRGRPHPDGCPGPGDAGAPGRRAAHQGVG